MRVYHFIGEQYGLEAVRLRRLKICRLDQSNDPFEIFAGTQSDLLVRQGMQGYRADIAQRLGIVCFSRDWHNPVMWGHYAESHRGLCLAFDADDSIAMPVSYVSKRIPFDHFLSSATTKEEVRSLFERFVATKYSHWRYEREVRAWAPLDPEGPDVQFHYFGIRLRLREVYIGCRSSIMRKDVLDALGDELKDAVKIVNTRPAFRTFRIVRQRNSKLWR